MAFKMFKLQIPIARRLLLRLFLFVVAIGVFMNSDPAGLFGVSSDGCDINDAFNWLVISRLSPSLADRCEENANLTRDVVKELMNENLLNYSAKALCLGEGSGSAILALREIGVYNALMLNRYPFLSLRRRDFVYDLDSEDNAFDFVYSGGALDRVSVPALLVLEIERVLRPGGIGAMLAAVPSSNAGSLIKSATPISLFLKNSDVVLVRGIRSFSLVVFKKKLNGVNPFGHYQLPNECPSVTNNKPFMEQLEPIMKKSENPVPIEGKFSYLPKFMDVSSRKRLVYIDVSPGQISKPNATNWFHASYPKQSRRFDVYVVDHNISVLSSYVKSPGITFVYFPDLAGVKPGPEYDPAEDYDPLLFDEGFDFVAWFKETVKDGDFVVLKTNGEGVELKLLHDLFESGAICLVDELFLRCPVSGDCSDLVMGLRSSGVFAHRWAED
ncbi:hypothetical protein GIB67_027664 [Kingdonia uniflora]|uniref:Methyltransferase type 11 domain-containing protein n=1 Tax=Kingdonia uniflora TaxID=39325 RepID=A0A7J7NL83_9MAGN|nr:hypothetical protein GIB67_027664 [Kingdonia uniflora]